MKTQNVMNKIKEAYGFCGSMDYVGMGSELRAYLKKTSELTSYGLAGIMPMIGWGFPPILGNRHFSGYVQEVCTVLGWPNLLKTPQ